MTEIAKSAGRPQSTSHTCKLRANISCYICRSDESRLWAAENGYDAVKCLSCGLIYVRNRPNLSEISESKLTGLHEGEESQLDTTGAYSPLTLTAYKRKIKAQFPELSTTKRPITWLDVGAGFGELLLAVRSLAPEGSTLTGIKPNILKRHHAIARGLDIRPAGFEGFEPGAFDVVSLVNVFSHLPDPASFIGTLVNFLKPSGSLLLVTGNGADLESRKEYPDPLYLPDHLCFAGESQIERIMAELRLHMTRCKRERLDTPWQCGKNIAKIALRRQSSGIIPYRSKFRILWLRYEHLVRIVQGAS